MSSKCYHQMPDFLTNRMH